MNIELYLRDLMQEFPDGLEPVDGPAQPEEPAHEYAVKGDQPKQDRTGKWPKQDWIGKWPKQDWIGKWPKQDWIGKWQKQDWIGQWPKQSAASDGLAEQPILPKRLLVRPEDFGSLIFDPATGRVFKADHEATEAVQAILCGQPLVETAAALHVDPIEINQVIAFVTEHISGDRA